MSPGLPNFLGSNRIGLAISSYQSGKFYLLGQNKDGGLLVDERFFRKAMGICVADKDTLLLATLFQIIKFKNVLNEGQEVNHVSTAATCRASSMSPASSTPTMSAGSRTGASSSSTRPITASPPPQSATASRRCGSRPSSQRSSRRTAAI
nr:DUF4915 domain-containing protein [Methyloceanibacter marginalis]